MNLNVADPEWGWWIVFYFYLGGIAAGAYFTAALIDLFGEVDDRRAARLGYLIAFPLIAVCGLLLILDLNRPERFWHMLLHSETVYQALEEGWPWSGGSWKTMVRAPLLKHWSPMSIGSWALSLFGLFSFLSFVASVRAGGRLERWFRRGWLGRFIQVAGSCVGFFVASYTGALLTATNQPIWSDSSWISALFLTSAASTGIAMVIVLALARGTLTEATRTKLERADRWVIILEFAALVGFVISLGSLTRSLWESGAGKLLLVGVMLLATLLPLGLHFRLRMRSRSENTGRAVLVASLSALVGGFVLRFAILAVPPELLEAEAAARSGRPEQVVETPQSGWGTGTISPEDGRKTGESGADVGGRPSEIRPRSKVFE